MRRRQALAEKAHVIGRVLKLAPHEPNRAKRNAVSQLAHRVQPARIGLRRAGGYPINQSKLNTRVHVKVNVSL